MLGWAHSAKELLPEGFKCPHCGHDEFKKKQTSWTYGSTLGPLGLAYLKLMA